MHLFSTKEETKLWLFSLGLKESSIGNSDRGSKRIVFKQTMKVCGRGKVFSVAALKERLSLSAIKLTRPFSTLSLTLNLTHSMPATRFDKTPDTISIIQPIIIFNSFRRVTYHVQNKTNHTLVYHDKTTVKHNRRDQWTERGQKVILIIYRRWLIKPNISSSQIKKNLRSIMKDNCIFSSLLIWYHLLAQYDFVFSHKSYIQFLQNYI